ncbi:MAG: potassium-transporting ATPase subunit KdpA [Thermoguttaceae bacterium]|jgi:K+-transporting ATPase ATPase A chain|nr:potassium-transporting ATPase subunit KdpA [Thermoguttaceae bacterium]
MTGHAILQMGLYLAVLLLLAKPLGWYMARVYEGKPCGLGWAVGWLERLIYRLCGIDPTEEMAWTTYAKTMLVLNLLGFGAVYALLRLQHLLPLNPEHLAAAAPDLAMNTAASFATNTNWQNYGGETTLSYLTQMLGLAVQNFLSAATGMAVLVALIRGFVRHSAQTIGNFWYDLTRSTLYILLPLSVVGALLLVSQGVVQTLRPYERATLVQPTKDASGKTVNEQTIALGPAASQVIIKQLGTNGGGFFNANSAHPLENPTPLTGFLELVAILLIAVALCYTFGEMVGDTRQGWAVLAAMLVIFVPLLLLGYAAEQAGNPLLSTLGVDQSAGSQQPGGNMEGKEVRFGIGQSAIWAAATTAASNGSVNSMHDSYTPMGGLVPMWLMQLSEVVFGGVGSGLYGMLVFAIIAVFVAGLMVGRTPEYLGKKIEAFEMKMAALVILIPPLLVLVGAALAVATPWGKAGVSNPGPHGLSEILYAFSSAGNNNGSAFAGLTGNTPFYNVALALAMLAARYWVAIPTLAIAGSLARKKATPTSAGTLPTHTPLFVLLLVGVVILVGALTFVPALALGPIVEQLMMAGG